MVDVRCQISRAFEQHCARLNWLNYVLRAVGVACLFCFRTLVSARFRLRQRGAFFFMNESPMFITGLKYSRDVSGWRTLTLQGCSLIDRI